MDDENMSIYKSEAEMLQLIHKLEVYQIELEMQNEELLKVKFQAFEAVKKYTIGPKQELFFPKLTGSFENCSKNDIKRISTPKRIKINFCDSE